MVAFDTLALPTRDGVGWTEQFGRVLIEAMACGVPVVGSSAGEIPVVIGDAGVVVPQDDAGALADVLGRLASSAEERARLATAGKARVSAHFTQEKVAEDTVAFYRSVRASSVE
jgi:glycosyltransferase involved in cell wall biosynthesis